MGVMGSVGMDQRWVVGRGTTETWKRLLREVVGDGVIMGKGSRMGTENRNEPEKLWGLGKWVIGNE